MIQDPTQKNFEDLTSPRQKTNKVGLGTLHKDLQDIRQELQGDASLNTNPVNPLVSLVPPKKQQDNQQNTPGLLEQLKASAIIGIKEALGVKVNPEDDVVRTAPEIPSQRIYDEFIQQVKQQQDLLLDATKEQTDIFKQLESTVEKLRTANHEDSKKLLASIDKLFKQLGGTPDTKAKSNIEKMMPLQQARAQATAARTSSIIANPVAAPRSAAIPALLQPTPMTPLYEDAGLISSESEGDRVQTGEREADMSSILGFLGNMMSGNSGSGTNIIGAPITRKPVGGPVKKTSPVGGATKKNMPLGGPTKTNTATNKGPMAKPTAAPKTSMLSKLGSAKGGLATIGLTLGADYAADKLGRDTKAGASADVAASTLGYAGTGALIGSFIPGLGTVAGGVIGGAYGATKGLLENKNTLFTPSTNKPDSGVLKQILENKELEEQVQQQPAAPVIINTQQTVGNNTPPAYIAPSLETRPKESALDRYINRQTVY